MDSAVQAAPRLRALGSGLAFSLLFALAFPPVGWWWASFIALLPLLWIGTSKNTRPWRTALWTALGMLPFYFFENAWIYKVTDLGYVPMCFVLVSYPTLFVWGLLRLGRKFPRAPMVLLAPLLWAGLEVARGEVVFEGYAWGFLGQPLIDAPPFANPATFLGWYFVSFLAAVPAACVIDARQGRRRWSIATLAALVMCWIALWVWRPTIAPSESWRFAVLQTNVPQDNKLDWTIELEVEDWRDFEGLIERAAGGSVLTPEVIILPETMMPGISLEPSVVDQLRKYGVTLPVRDASGNERRLEMSAFADRLFSIQSKIDIPMLIGEEGLDGFHVTPKADGSLDVGRERRFNSVYLVAGGEVKLPRYDKILLTPFGEFMPYIEYWPWLQQQVLALGARGMAFDLAHGRDRRVLLIPRAGKSPVSVVTPICFEITRSDHCRRMVFDPQGHRRAQVVVNPTNDGWFAWCDFAREQHLQVTRWRSLETATPTIRAANTGISAHIDARGQIIKSGIDDQSQKSKVAGVLSDLVNLGTGSTVYARVGPIFQWAAFVGACGILAIALLPSRKRSSP